MKLITCLMLFLINSLYAENFFPAFVNQRISRPVKKDDQHYDLIRLKVDDVIKNNLENKIKIELSDANWIYNKNDGSGDLIFDIYKYHYQKTPLEVEHEVRNPSIGLGLFTCSFILVKEGKASYYEDSFALLKKLFEEVDFSLSKSDLLSLVVEVGEKIGLMDSQNITINSIDESSFNLKGAKIVVTFKGEKIKALSKK